MFPLKPGALKILLYEQISYHSSHAYDSYLQLQETLGRLDDDLRPHLEF